MSLPPVTKTWTFLPNNRVSFVSLLDTSSRIMFGIKNFLVATMGYTVKYTCDGTTGPSSTSDHTDRWLTFTNAQTRASTLTSGPQSFVVLTNGSGCDICISFAGASDDNFVVQFSPGGLYVPAGTPTQAPTATDNQQCVAAASIITNLSTGDRVWHVMATTDKTMFRAFIYRASVLTYSFGVEVIAPTINPSAVFTSNTVGWATNYATLTSVTAGHIMGTGSASQQGVARINSTNITLGGCGECFLGSAANPVGIELPAGAMIVPVGYFSQTAGMAGKVGNRIDCWYAYNAVTPAQGDSFGDLSHVMFGTGVWPWDGVTLPEVS